MSFVMARLFNEARAKWWWSASSTCLDRMTRGSILRALVAVCASVLAPVAHALDPHRLLEQYIYHRWTDEQGHQGGAVNAFAETPDGYLWLGAENGLIRFDGLTFRLFNHANTDLFPASAVLSLATDAEGDLWILLQSRELLRYHRGVFEPIVREAGVTAIAPGMNHDLLLVRPENPTRYVGQKFVRIAPAPGYTSHLVISVAETPTGTVWMGTRDYGLFALRDGKAFAASGLPDRKVNCLLAGDAGVLWIGTDRGLAKWNGSEVIQTGVPTHLRSAQVMTMTRDHDANLWVGTTRGLMRMTAQGAFDQEERIGEPADPVTALFEDREGNLWIGRRRGFERWRDRLFLTYSPSATQAGKTAAPSTPILRAGHGSAHQTAGSTG